MFRPLALLLLASPASAWEFSPLPVCTVTDTGQPIQTRVTYDPATRLYAIELTFEGGWPPGPVFALQFTGSQTLTISTDRHRLSEDGKTLTVTDSGFGNVLNGLQFNDMAVAMIGGDGFFFSLAGAADPVERFRNCGASLTG